MKLVMIKKHWEEGSNELESLEFNDLLFQGAKIQLRNNIVCQHG